MIGSWVGLVREGGGLYFVIEGYFFEELDDVMAFGFCE